MRNYLEQSSKVIRTIPILAVVLVAVARIKSAAGGAIVATGAVFAGAFGATSIFGMSIVKAFAVGALAFNFNAFVVAPLMGVTMNGFEIGTPSDPTPKPGEGPVHPGYRK